MARVDAVKVLNGVCGAVVFIQRVAGAVVLVSINVSKNVRPMLCGMKNALPHLIAEAEDAAPRLVSAARSVVLNVLYELTV